MKKIFKKIKNRAGETLVETLAAILVAALSAATLAMGIMTSTQSETKITEFQREIEAQVSAAEICDGTTEKSLNLFLTDAEGDKIEKPKAEEETEIRYYEQQYSVVITGGENKITSFKLKSSEEAGE